MVSLVPLKDGAELSRVESDVKKAKIWASRNPKLQANPRWKWTFQCH